MKNLSQYAPWIVVGLAILYLIVVMSPVETGKGMDLDEFGKVPVLDHGRVKPIDTLARNSLMAISGGYQTYKDEKGNTQPATKWLLEVMTAFSGKHRDSEKVKGFRIEDPEIQKMLGLPERADALFAWNEIEPRAEALFKAAAEAKKNPNPNEHEKNLGDLGTQVAYYTRYAAFETPYKVFRIDNLEVLQLLGLERRSGYKYGYDEFLPRIGLLVQESERARGVDEKKRDTYDVKVLEVAQRVSLYSGLASQGAESLKVIPRLGSKASMQADRWKTFAEGLQDLRSGDKDPAAAGWAQILHDYAGDKPEAFNRDVASYRKLVYGSIPNETGNAGLEMFFNQFAPFYHCMILYVLVCLLAAFSWVGFQQPLARTAFWLAVVVLAVHTWALIARMWIQGRPPVTNLYSSAVFIGWVCLILALVLEVIYKLGLGTLIAGVTGALTMLVAYYLGGSGDTMEELQAVLDTNFWLATHVVCVTIGYAATFLAGFFGILYVCLRLFTPTLPQSLLRTVAQIIYGIVCFATLFSFVGTVLGGIWADQSWGRFWGWDPKENGALLIVIMNALILHARWGGMIKQRGMAVLAIVGNMVTGWSWFGTNQLGIGLHSYGFSNALATGLMVFWVVMGVFLVVGSLPLEWLWSKDVLKLGLRPAPAFPNPTPAPTAVMGKKRNKRDKHAAPTTITTR